MSSPQKAPSSRQDNDQDEPDADERTKRFHYLDTSVPLYQAALKGDWKVAKALFEKYPDVFRRPITERKETALHIAVAAEHGPFVKELVKRMTPEDVALRNENGNTALCFAAFADGSRIVLIAKEMVEANKELPLVRSSKGKTPLYMAALNGRRKMVSYLYDVTPFEDLSPTERIDILFATISTDMYDIALAILKKDLTLATMENTYKRIALQELAIKPLAFGSRSQLLWERCLNSWFKGMCNKASAHELVELLWREVLVLPKDKFADLFDNHSTFLFKAAELGNVEFLIILLRSYPDLIWKVDKKKRTIFHIAVKHRQESVFTLIYEIGNIKGMIAKYTDENSKNNMLHLAGRLAPLDRLNTISGAPLQMQRELLWFREIEKIVPPLYRKLKNIDQKGKRVDTCICECMVNINQRGQVGDKDQGDKAADTPSEDKKGQHGDKDQDSKVGDTPSDRKRTNTDKKGQHGNKDQDGEAADTPSNLKRANIDQKGQHGDKDQDGKAADIPSDMKTMNTDQKGQPGVKDQDGELADTPWELFTEEHKELKEQGEKWMKDTANYCMVVAALIATVVFAATFTVPGGNNQEGTPIFLKSKWFMVFFISDVLALLSSSTSILIFLSILTSRYAEKDFLMSLPARLLFGLTTLFVSIASMVVAFSATCFLVYYSEVAWVPIVIIASAGVPVTLFVLLHYQLWVDIFRSTYSPRFLFRPHKHRLF